MTPQNVVAPASLRCSDCGLNLELNDLGVRPGIMGRWRLADLGNCFVAVEVHAGSVVSIVCNGCVVKGAVGSRNRTLCACGNAKSEMAWACGPCAKKKERK